jgi:hypothetical protein
VLLAVLVVGGIVWYATSSFDTGGVDGSQTQVSVPLSLVGTLYLTLPRGTDTPRGILENSQPEGIRFDIQSDAISPLVADGVRVSVQHSISNNGKWITFLGIQDQGAEVPPENESLSLYRGMVDNARGSISQVTDLYSMEHTYARQSPTVSDDGKIAVSIFDSQDEPSALSLALGYPGVGESSKWRILIFDSEGQQMTTLFGTQPQWATNSVLVYLTNEGPTAYNVEEETEYALMRVAAGVVSTNSMLDVSDNGAFLVWTLPDSRLVYVLEIRDLENPQQATVYSRQIIEGVLGFWPVLSVDGSFVTLLELNEQESEDGTGAKLSFFDMSNGERLPYSIDVSNYDVSQLALTDWK